MKLKSLSWHDGLLEGISFQPNYKKKNKLILYLSLYREQIHSSKRYRLKLVCIEVDWFKTDINMSDLVENSAAGNINHGEMHGSILRIELFGGDILVKAEKYKVMPA